ncbi:hypothetical protein C8J57DRAFT_1291213 [Mycena rebaudengoi]|nr:hypothetical protein C8J57DRAFT_1291213 [Mycena rebaudengoi]
MNSPVKFHIQSCSICRQRKTRCDGGNPCLRCSRARTPVVCTYDRKTAEQLYSHMPKGGACVTCRKRKRKCDGNLPCRSCKRINPPNQCHYRGNTTIGKRKSGTHDSKQSLSSKATSSSSSCAESSTLRQSTTFPMEVRLEFPHTLGNSHSEVLFWPDWNKPTCSEYEMCSDNTASDSSGNSNPITETALPTFPRYPFLPAPPRSTADLFSYGLSLTRHKREAISAGDTSGRIVHPILVYVCQMLGYLLSDSSPKGGPAEAAAERSRLVLGTLEGLYGPIPDPLICLQAYTLLVLYCVRTKDMRGTEKYILKAGSVVVRHNAALGLDDTTDADCLPELGASYLSPRSEARAAFSQLIYLDVAQSLVLKVPGVLDPVLVAKFRRLSAVHWADRELNFLRAKCVVFLADSQEVAAELSGTATIEWSTRYWNLMGDIHVLLDRRNQALIEMAFIPDLSLVLPTLKTCNILMLAALAELYAVLAPYQTEYLGKHLEVVANMANCASSFSAEDQENLDPTLATLLSIALQRDLEGERPSSISVPAIHECVPPSSLCATEV